MESVNPSAQHKMPMPPIKVPDDFMNEDLTVPTGEVVNDDDDSPAKDLGQVAKEVLLGEWGRGQECRKALADAGYDPNKVKKEIVRLLNEPR